MTVVWTIASPKGGVAKTTLTVGLASAALEAGRTVTMLDGDAMTDGSSIGWITEAEELEEPFPAALTVLGVGRPADIATSLRSATDLVIIDTPPGNPAMIDAAIDAADLVIAPASPTIADVRRAVRLVEVAEAAGKQAVVVLTRIETRTQAAREYRTSLTDNGITVAATAIPRRAAIAAAYGLPLRPATLRLFEALYDELEGAS